MIGYGSPEPLAISRTMKLACPILEARHLGRRRPGGTGWLLEDVSLAVYPGERVVLTGPSGSGKTLLLRALALLDPLDAGEVAWRGERVGPDQTPAYRCKVLYLHQRATLIDRTVDEALKRPFALRAHRDRTFDGPRIVEFLRRVGRDESFLGKAVRDLSGGETQIAALLRALQLDPEVLLLDEPTAAADATTSRAIEDLLLEWCNDAANGRALVWVSHDPEQNGRVGRRGLCIEAGRLRGSAPPRCVASTDRVE